MEGFQKIVVITAAIILLFSLVFMSIAIAKGSGETWPPVIADCPDWWIIDGSGNNSTCINVKDLGTCASQHQGNNRHQTMNFNTDIYSGSNGDCNKYNWANKCNISWDGITYGVENPCSSTTTTTT
jgi:hypothetical protein